MKAIIDIKTKAGQSLEGFPHTLSGFQLLNCRLNLILDEMLSDCVSDPSFQDPVINKGDKITIEIV